MKGSYHPTNFSAVSPTLHCDNVIHHTDMDPSVPPKIYAPGPCKFSITMRNKVKAFLEQIRKLNVTEQPEISNDCVKAMTIQA